MKSMLLSRLLYFLDELLDAPLFISVHKFSMFVKSFKFWKGSINWNFEWVVAKALSNTVYKVEKSIMVTCCLHNLSNDSSKLHLLGSEW